MYQKKALMTKNITNITTNITISIALAISVCRNLVML
jgi:hypothetical protein